VSTYFLDYYLLPIIGYRIIFFWTLIYVTEKRGKGIEETAAETFAGHCGLPFGDYAAMGQKVG
jgi:hypothetical protein